MLGFESADASLTGGIQTTGNYPGRARNVGELRSDLEVALSLIPGAKRVNLHAIYLESNDSPIERDKIEPRHFQGWIDWAKQKRPRARFQSDMLFASEQRTEPDAEPS